jgi:hypothetical protein
MTTETHTFDEMFFPVLAVPIPICCECCGENADNYYQLDGDAHSAYACRDCAEKYLEEVNAGMWEW